jgi:hypothetical protein
MTYYFICGLPRSGTSYLVTLLNQSSNILVFGETHYFGRSLNLFSQKKYNKDSYYDNFIISDINKCIKSLSAGLDEKLVEAGSQKLSNLNDYASSADAYRCWISTLYDETNSDIIIEKTPNYIKYWKDIFSSFPDSKLIVTYRNPYDWILSYKFKYLTATTTEKIALKTIKNQYNIITTSFNYRSSVESLMKLSESRTSQCLIIKNEELRNGQNKALSDILCFFNCNSLSIHDFNLSLSNQINTSFDANNTIKQLSELEVFIVNLLCFPKGWASFSGYKKKYLKFNVLLYVKFAIEVLNVVPYTIKTIFLLSSRDHWPSPLKTLKYLISSALR